MRRKLKLMVWAVCLVVSIMLFFSPLTSLAAEKEIVRITAVADPGGIGMGLKISSQAFMQKHPEIQIAVFLPPWAQLMPKYMLDHQAKTGAYDVVCVLTRWMSSLAGAGYLTPLENYVEKQKIDMNQYYEGALAGSYYEGTLYGMPYMPNIWTLFARKDIFEEAGLTLPETFDEYLETARKLTRGDMYGTALMGGRGENIFSFYYYAATYEALGKNVFFDENWKPVVDKPAAVEALTMMVKISKYAPPGVGEFGWHEGYMHFAKGRLAMVEMPSDLAGIWEDPNQSDVVGKVTATIPTVRRGQVVRVPMETWTVAIPAWSKYKDAAFEFIAFHTGKEMDKELLLAFGCPPSMPGTFDDPLVLKKYPYYDRLLPGFMNARPIPIEPGVLEAHSALMAEINAAIVGQKTAEEALKDATKRMTEIMGEYGYYK